MQYKDLKPAKDNFNFSIDILECVFNEKLKTSFSMKNVFIILSGAKGFGKSYLICLLSLFMFATLKTTMLCWQNTRLLPQKTGIIRQWKK